MNAIVAAAMLDRADLAYESYVEAFHDLHTPRLNIVDLFDKVYAVEQATDAFEAEALSLALCDYLAGTARRSRVQFRGYIVPPEAVRAPAAGVARRRVAA